MEALAILAVAVIIYFLPGMIGAHRNHVNSGAIYALNFFLGWTLVGWVAALVWALTDKVKKPDAVDATKKCPFCAEDIKSEATVCRFCGRQQGPQEAGITQSDVDAINASLGTRYSKADIK